MQNKRHIAPDISDHLVRPVVVRTHDMVPGQIVAAHTHAWGQLAYASQGVLSVLTEQGNWVVPPQRAVWIPAGTLHSVETPRGAHFRSLHVANESAKGLPESCCVLSVSSLLREMLMAAAKFEAQYDSTGSAGRLMQVILDEIKAADRAPLYLPMPTDERLRRVADALLENPALSSTQEELARMAGASGRTLLRGFLRETGMSFSAWRQQCRLMASLELLVVGKSVTSVALDMGYESPSAFIAMFKRLLGKSPSAYFADR